VINLPLHFPPDSLCLLRLSAIGDISHTLPTLRTLQAAWPDTRISWIIGKTEHALVGDIPGVDFIIFDKALGWRAYAALREQLRGRRFDLLLHMQMSLRASLISLLVEAPIKLGFDRERAKDLQWLFTNARIHYHPRQHVLDSLLGFPAALGIRKPVVAWDIPIPARDRAWAAQTLPEGAPVLVISPCSSMAYRNWSAEGYAKVADFAAERYAMRVVLSGGPSRIERAYAEQILQRCAHPPLDLIGRTSLKQLLALLERATLLIAPDSGPAHLATAVGLPVIGLYAATNPDRARPYLSADWVVNRYPEAVQAKFGKHPDALPWGQRVRDEGTMARISPDAVLTQLQRFMQQRAHP